MFLAPGMVTGCLMTTWGWLSLDDWEDEFLPMPGAAIPQPAVLQPNKRHRPSMPTIPEEPGRSSSSASGLPGGGSGASGLPAEGRNANNMEQCLQMLGSYLERKKRFDNRGYRSQIRRQLRRLLDDNDIHYPDWLDDHTQPVNEWRDRAFKEIQSIKKTGKLTTQTGPSTGQTGPVPVSPAPVSGGASGLPAEGTGLSAIWQVQQQMTGLQSQLSAALAQLQPPPETPREKEKEKEQPTSPSSDIEVEAVDPRKTVSEPPRSPRPMVEEQSLQAGGNQDAGANGLPEEGIAGVQPEETAGVSSGTSLPAQTMQESNLNRLQRCLLVPMACLKKALQEASLNKLQVCFVVPMACLQKAVLCWQTLCLQVCLLLALGLQQVGIWSRNLSRTCLQLPPNQWPTCLKLTKMRWTFLSSKVAALEVAHWCWSSLPEEGNSFFTQLGPSQPSQWLKKKACRAEVGVNNTSDLKTLFFFHEEKNLILDYSIFFSLHQPWSFFTFEILILCGDFFSIQRFLERNLFLTKQHLIAMVCQWIFWAKKKISEFSMEIFSQVFFSRFPRVKSS